ncbi:hypothetical protein AVEN_117240-1 [Araneus ventricosus]|uniref:Uncharacterized protein n=1 Tax=Araneus ventricosus TaxID=182803 RepID=A0A4Y2AZN8_ARAVE|nr:hypothetical protein AVEN_117240-1 [Araneus ventricosus]
MISDKLRAFTNLIHLIQSCCCEYKSCDSSTLENHLFNAKLRIKKDSEDKNAGSNESKCEAMDTSETFINENGATNDEPNVAVDNLSLSEESHGPESHPNSGESSHSSPKKYESKKKAKYIVKRQHKNRKHSRKKKKHL